MAKKQNDIQYYVDDEGKPFPFEGLFIGVSVLFLIIIFGFYGLRYYDYHKAIEADKAFVSLSEKIIEDNEITTNSSGLYYYDGNYVFRGDVDNNYLEYDGLLWRIMSVNKDGSVKIITDNSVNKMSYNNEVTSYQTSDIYDYLFNEFGFLVNDENVDDTKYYDGIISDINSISTDTVSVGKVVLCDVVSFVNSIVDNKTYLAKENQLAWLLNWSEEKVYHSNSDKLSVSRPTEYYDIRPVVTLCASLEAPQGDGSKNNPYHYKQQSVNIGSVILLGNDSWIVYKMDKDNYYLVSKNAVSESNFGIKGSKFSLEEKNNIATYLNGTYYNSLSYKDMLVKVDWNIGDYSSSYHDCESQVVNCYVGMNNYSDLKMSEESNYYLLTTSNRYAFVYGDNLELFNPVLKFKVVPTIAISKNNVLSEDSDGIFRAGN